MTASEEVVAYYEDKMRDASDVMKRKLPAYIIDSFLVAGYDTLDAIADMDVKSSQNNSIQEIEEYISKERQGDPRFSPGKTSSGGFMYPPAHRKLIEKFVSEIKGMKRGNTNDCPVPPKRKCCRQGAKSTENQQSTDLPTIYGEIRQQITKWQRKSKDESIQQLKEHEQYEVCVKVSETSGNVASITCHLCGKPYKLGQTRGKAIISNWTKHVSKCVANQKSASTPTLHNYFSSNNKEVAETSQHFRLSPPS